MYPKAKGPKATSGKKKHNTFASNGHDHHLSEYAGVLLLYCQDLPQTEIALRTGLGTTRVNKIIKEAQHVRDVSVEYKLKLPTEEKLQGKLFHLFPKDMPQRNAVVMPLDMVKDKSSRLAAIGQAGAVILENILKDGTSLTIDGGESVASVIASLRRFGRSLKLYPVAGGPWISPATSVPALIGRFLGACSPADKLEAHLLPEPAAKGGRTPQQKASINEVREKAAAARVFLLGVGTLGRSYSNTARELVRELAVKKSLSSTLGS